jgi:hypothetical protein
VHLFLTLRTATSLFYRRGDQPLFFVPSLGFLNKFSTLSSCVRSIIVSVFFTTRVYYGCFASAGSVRKLLNLGRSHISTLPSPPPPPPPLVVFPIMNLLYLSLLVSIPLVSAASTCRLTPASSLSSQPSSSPSGSLPGSSSSNNHSLIAGAWYPGWLSTSFPPSRISWQKYSLLTWAFALVSFSFLSSTPILNQAFRQRYHSGPFCS